MADLDAEISETLDYLSGVTDRRLQGVRKSLVKGNDVAGLLAVTFDKGLMKKSFERLWLHCRVKDKQRVEAMRDMLQTHLSEKNNAVVRLRGVVSQQKESLVTCHREAAKLKTTLQDLSMKVTYAKENLLLDQIEAESTTLRDLEREVDRMVATSHEDLPFCKACLRLQATHEPKSFGFKETWGSLTTQRKKEIVMVNMVHNLRQQLEVAKQGNELRQKYNKDMQVGVENIYLAFKEGTGVKHAKPPDDTTCRLLQANIQRLRTSISAMRNVVHKSVHDTTTVLHEAGQRVTHMAHGISTSVLNPAAILAVFDTMYDQFKKFCQGADIPGDMDLRCIDQDPLPYTKLAARDLVNSDSVITELSDRCREIHEAVVGSVTTACSLNATYADKMNKVQKRLNVFEDMEQTLSGYKDVETDLLKKVKTLEREVFRVKSEYGNRSNAGQPGASQHSLREMPIACDATTNTPHVESKGSETLLRCASKTYRTSNTNTAVLATIAVQTEQVHRRNVTNLVITGRQQVSQEVQTIDLDHAAKQTETDFVKWADASCGPTRVETAVETDFDQWPGHVDGVTSTTTTFCLAQSKHGAASKAYSEVRYICVDDECEEEKPPPPATALGCASVVEKLRAALHVSFLRVDTLSKLMATYQKLQMQLQQQEDQAKGVSRWSEDERAGAVDHPLPADASALVAEVMLFDANVALSHLPDLTTPTPPRTPPQNRPKLRTMRPHPRQQIPSHGALVRKENRQKPPITLPSLSLKPLTTRITL